MEWIISNIVIVAILIAVILVVTILMTGYVKAPPDMAFIISGLRKNPVSLSDRQVSRYLSWKESISFISDR